jgi:beta-D-xylosidase 4
MHASFFNIGSVYLVRITFCFLVNVNAGLDLDCGAYYPDSLQNAVMQGEVAETEIDKSLKYLYVVLMRLGFFDGSPSFKSLGKDHVCSDEHI